ncbi:MAG TPA: HlyD family efflux transporter periplasmic adaptor subunit [Rhizomicrobium sp.]|nr:HlyD family efflux transporter periplasmic adaptor subunit [Rhizomicrobium sp.]
MSDASSGNPANGNGAARRRGLIILSAVVIIGAVLWGIYWFAYARYFEATNDAYVAGDIVAITSREPATVLAIHADNTQAVTRGQLLIELDPARAKAAMESAEAELGRIIRSVRSDFSRVHQFDSQISAAKVQLAQAEGDYRRRREGAVDGSVSAEEVAHAREAVASARAALRVAESGQAQVQAAVDNTSVANNPNVLAAIARVHDAAITLAHMRLISPVNGVVAQRTVQVGQQVAAGTPLMAVVPLDQVWIDANFKEGQLRDMRVGQPVEVTADIYGGSVTYHGHVAGLGAGSGAAFSLLPPQNASGNWIKIVQRVPVRISLDPKELRDHPLRIGLSVSASVDVRDTSGPMVSSQPLNANMRGQAVDADAEADRIVARILAANGASK